MNRAEFMRQLESLLQSIPAAEREEAIQYYNDYFDDAGNDNEQEVIEALGNPARVAENIKRDLLESGYGEAPLKKALASERKLIEYGEPENPQAATPDQDLTSAGTETVAGTGSMEGTATVAGTGSMEGTETVAGTGSMEGTATVAGTGSMEGTATVAGTGSIAGTGSTTGTGTGNAAGAGAGTGTGNAAGAGSGSGTYSGSAFNSGAAGSAGYAGMGSGMGANTVQSGSPVQPGQYSGWEQPRQAAGSGQSGKSGQPGKTGMPGWAVALIVICVVFASPMLLGITGTLLGVLASWFLMIFSFGVAALALFIAAVVLVVVGIMCMFVDPVSGIAVAGGGLLAGGIGIFFLMLTVAMAGIVTPAIFRGIGFLLGKCSSKKRR